VADDSAQLIRITDLRQLAESEAPDLADAIIAFLGQPDPSFDEDLPDGALDVYDLKNLLRQAYYNRDQEQRRVQIAEAWQRFLSQTKPPPPPRYFLAELLVDLYENGGEPARAALIEIARAAPLNWGVWGGLKRIYKLAETRHDAEMFGVLASRLDQVFVNGQRGEVSSRTIFYLRTRAWRWLRQLGRAMPALYPQFAVQVLRHYPSDFRFDGSWIANHIFRHGARQYTQGRFWGSMPDDLIKDRAYPEAWKSNPDPLMLLLETCIADAPAKFAIQGLRKDFPKALRNATPGWLERIAARPLASVHDFVVDTLKESPELHQGKLRGLGLHETVLTLLISPSGKARQYAIEYAMAHAQDLAGERLAELLAAGYDDTIKYAISALQARPASQLGHPLLGRLLALPKVAGWAGKALDEGFDRNDLPRAFLVDMIYGADGQRAWAVSHLERKYQPGEIGADFWKSVLDDPRQANTQKNDRNAHAATKVAFDKLGTFGASKIGAAWLIDAATRPGFLQPVTQWLQKADELPGLDVEKVKGLVFDPTFRGLGLALLGNPKLVKFRELSLGWLLALARRADPTLSSWASRYLLQHVAPADFADAAGGDGVARLFQLALGAKEPEPVRLFAQMYLRCNHPVIGPDQPESKSYQLKPQMTAPQYSADRHWPALADVRADVRRFAILITKTELRNWGYHTRVYDLADSDQKDVRSIAYDALLRAGDPAADPACTLAPAELDAARVFAMTESRIRSTRDTAMELIARHYTRLGGPEKLAWLMTSADRSVRVMAVRILWEKHRPRDLPPGWQPKGKQVVPIEDAGRFADVEALRDFLRTVLFGLPPGRQMEPAEGARRHIAASVAKEHAIEVCRDLGEEDEAFARLVAPVLLEWSGSLARTEWQACLTALVHMQHAHPNLDLGIKPKAPTP
jgi:hypothetical protein